MRKPIRVALFLLAVFVPLVSNAEEEERVVVTPKPEPTILDLRIGIGSMLSPTLFALSGSAEFRLDRFFSLGPMVQFGFSDDEQITVPSLAARFILPLSFAKAQGGTDLELSLHTGFGAMFRSEGTFDFEDFAYQAGFNADYYAIRALTVGIGMVWIVTSSSVERSTGMLYASAGYHF